MTAAIRPKGMHQKTYARLREKVLEEEQHFAEIIGASLANPKSWG